MPRNSPNDVPSLASEMERDSNSLQTLTGKPITSTLTPRKESAHQKSGSDFSDSMLEGLTHELKSPLAAIESAISMLEDMLTSDLKKSRQSKNYLGMIKRNTKRLYQFINNLLQVFKQSRRSHQLANRRVHMS